MGQRITHLLIERIGGSRTPISSERLATKLVVRQSTAHRPASP
jgi:DNA-binding LacI/PurR family transcriptional regulator